MKRPDSRDRLLYVGKTHSGKSYALKKRLREWLTAGARVVAVDPCDEYSRHGRGSDLGPLAERVTAAELAERPELLLKARLSLAVVPAEDSVKGWARAFLLVSGLLRRAGRPVVLVADEVGAWTDSSAHPQCHRARSELISLATNGRHRGIALALVAQRAGTVPLTVRSQLSEIVSFRQDEPEDLAALAERIGEDQANSTARLAVGQSIQWRDTLTTAAPKEHKKCSTSPAS